MTHDTPDDSEIEAQLNLLAEKGNELIDRSLYRDSFRIFGDLRQRAKRERKLFHYIIGTFHQMDQAQYLFDFQTMRERAVELISLLESEEQCRKIQPDLSIQMFEGMAYQFSSCAYENLAEATGQMEGYNSEGLQACIADGLQICRQTGKMSCIGCFREYSCDVYMAADDSEIAQHQCNLVLDESSPLSSRGDRRWLARKKIAWMTFLEGRTQTAIDMYREALALTDAEEVNLKLESKLRVLFELDALLILTGQPTELEQSSVADDQPPVDQCPMYDLLKAQNASLQSVMQGDFATATDHLVHWDRLLREKHGIHLWFEVRLRLVAIKLLAGDAKAASKLAKELEQRARQASDWLTLRRLTALQDPDLIVSPLATFRPALTEANRPNRDTALTPPTASAELNAVEPIQTQVVAPENKSEDIATEDPPVTPYGERLEEIGNRFELMSEEAAAEELREIRDQLRQIDPATVTHEYDACTMLRMMTVALSDGDDTAAIWTWANQLATNFQENPAVLSMLGDLGNHIRFGIESEFGSTITAERVEPLFRKAIQLQDAGPGTFLRAGDHYMAEQNYGEAERCYARSFRLKRDNGQAAIKLASLYRETDRLRDALHVLDVCIREGADIPQVAWEAGLTAFALKRYEVMLAYLDRYKDAVGSQLWVDYYRATGLLEQGRPAEAIEAIDAEQELFSEPGFHIFIIRGCAYAQLGDTEAASADFQSALHIPFYEIGYLSQPGIGALLARAHETVRSHMTDSGLATLFESRLLESYTATEELFEPKRQFVEAREVKFFQCAIRQPLDDNWAAFPGRFANEDPAAEFYFGTWGVLADDEQHAQQLVLEWQNRCYPSMAEIIEVSEPSEVFIDSPGVVWQGQRVAQNDAMMEDDDDDVDNPNMGEDESFF